MKKHLLFFAFTCFAMVSLAQTPKEQVPGQTLRGKVTDADTGEPLSGTSISLLKSTAASGTSSSASGTYSIEKLPVGRYQVQASHLGYETVTIAEVLVEAGRETVLNIQLREQPNQLQEVVVKAPSNNQTANPLNQLISSVEEQFRFPATNFDPARLAMAYPGVAGNNDGTNVISVRGNSPNALQWRLEGVEIVNPNHTANAGTFGDRPTGAGGGVNILSAQLLGTSTMYTGAFPAQYGNSLGGIMDMYFRKGNDQRHELIAQAGFIGIEAAAEGPIGVGSSIVGSWQSGGAGRQNPSFLVNYRYSFTGLLTAMGADFGDEETAFQDVAFHVSLPSAKSGQFSLFGVGGKSSTLYHSPNPDSATMDKERFNIDFQSKMGALGMTHILPLGKNSVLRTVAIASALEHDRTADFIETGDRWEDDSLRQQKLAFSSIFSHKISARHRMRVGVEAAYNDDSVYSFLKNDKVSFKDDNYAVGWVVQPFLELHSNLGEKIEVVAGFHSSIFTTLKKEVLPEPRFSLNYAVGKGRFTLAYGLHSQSLPIQLTAFLYPMEFPSASKAHHLTAGYQFEFANDFMLKAEAYLQRLSKVPVYLVDGGAISTINLTDFSQTYLSTGWPIEQSLFRSHGVGRNYGLDISLQKYLTERYFLLLSGSFYHSEYSDADGKWHSTRFDGRHTLNLTAGREFAKQKNGKTTINGISGRVAWLGGFRESQIDVVQSKAVGYTVFDQENPFSEKLDDYFRIDLRLYKKWNKVGKNSMLSLDIQNVTSRKNAQYHYYDSVQDKVLLKKQLGLIPILTWRGEF